MTNQQRRFSKHHRRPRAETARPALKTLPLAVALCFSAPLWADTINPGTVAGLPTGGTVAAGTVSSQLTSSQLTLTQSTQRAVIDWQSFNIDAGKAVQFIQPNASAAVLNRVAASANMSQIYGSMTANGTVVLMNPNGVYFHQGANINVGSLIVTTGRIDQSQFMAEGPITIDDAISGSITNEGSITAANAGLVALVAPSVVNKGAIIATGGRIALSGADRATVSLNSGLYEFAVPAGAQGTNATISNMAGARLEGKTILLSTGDAANLVSGVINLQGVQQASSAIVVDGDTVVLKSDLDAPIIAGNSNTIQVHDTASIPDALQIAKTGTV
ncbi:MAG: filamentous hemagglutinin N-terminal domain-containing protein, partial [Pseudomonadota bacterium]|nr:filamentous hemagglutinin N-terminal domain-containing protein [Pseudomonadota bacterium]